MSQSRKKSLLEAMTNIAVGFGVSLISSVVILPMYGAHISLQANFKITIWFTAISLLRSYFLRRWFNRMEPA